MEWRRHDAPPRSLRLMLLAVIVAGAGCVLAACGSSATKEETSGPTWTKPASISETDFSADGAVSANDSLIDVSSVADGVVGASATSTVRLKFTVTSGDETYNYDLPQDGTPIEVPLNMGDGTYTFRVMRNTSGNNYVEVNATTTDVTLSSEFAPYLRPNVYCDYSADSACVAKAAEVT